MRRPDPGAAVLLEVNLAGEPQKAGCEPGEVPRLADAARAAGLTPLVIEKAPVAGGTTAFSHGALWLPGNPLMRAAGIPVRL